MIQPIRKAWQEWQAQRRFRRCTADLPDYLLRDLGLERDRVGRAVMRHVLPPRQ
ncbi:DUF1127 domain-containing protein [Albidovulum sp.]|jgi:uncharacterized protein YjiS (DUF1127 family)|uniref:DUF1127 domain-containing protein n=1 Tax=Albidovulum sp. TaxID=1872424 RepID=UPI003043768A